MKPPEGRYVKGNVVIDYVKMIRGNPDRPWSEHLLPEDLEIVDRYILPGSWYPIEFFQRIGLAVFKLIANENNAILHAYGASMADRLNEEYPGMVTKGRPRDTLAKYVQIQRSFYSFDAFEIEDKVPNQLIVHIYSTSEEVGIPVYIEQISGMIERLIQVSDGRNVNIKVIETVWKGEHRSSMEVSWED